MISNVATEDRNKAPYTCAQCGQSFRTDRLVISESTVVCAQCRCFHCGIVLSEIVCRCGVAHGLPSSVEGLCERCFQLRGTIHPQEPDLAPGDYSDGTGSESPERELEEEFVTVSD